MKTAPVLVAAALAAGGCAHLPPGIEAAQSLAAAESAFAAHSVREDMRAAFLANFAEDGVYIRTGWVVTNAFLRTQAAPPIVLDWRPAYVETAKSGDFGLSTGPWKLTGKASPAAAPAFGQFVSIWKRQTGAPWKVAVDLGISHADPVFWDRALETAVASGAPSSAAGSLDTAEQRFAVDAGRDGSRAAYGRHGAANLRFYRGGIAPAVGRDAALASTAMNDDRLVYTVDRSEMASSGDFGYARGSYAAAAAPSKVLGYFMRAWRVEGGEWKVALDVTNVAR